MQLKLKRSQRSGGMMGGKVFFVLDARADLATDEQNLVKKYNLGKLIVYDSEARKKHTEAAGQHFESASNTPIRGSTGGTVARSLWSNAQGLARIAAASLTLRVTVDSLTSSEHIECKDMNELLGAESAIIESCRNVKAYLDTALTFDGREEVVEF
jgi:hypothetical protein